MDANESAGPELCYLSSDHLEAPMSCSQLDVCTRGDETIGALDGVIIDRATRQLRFLVVAARRQAGHPRVLVPFPQTQLDAVRPALKVDIDPQTIADCEVFDPKAFESFPSGIYAVTVPLGRRH